VDVHDWSNQAVHDTVAALVSDRAYKRSILGSLLGRAAVAVINAIGRLMDAARNIPGGRVTVIVIVVVIAGLIAARILMTSGWRDDVIQRRAKGPRPQRADPWADAERLASLGDHTGAAHALYQAVLRRLAGADRIRLHASKTSGDYSRELRRRGSPAAGAFQQFGRRFDHVIFGLGECSPEEFDAMLRDASEIARRQVA
jgi:hypothetical protein